MHKKISNFKFDLEEAWESPFFLISDEYKYLNIQVKWPANIIRIHIRAISGVWIYLDIRLVNMLHLNIFGYWFGTECGIQIYSDIHTCPFYDICSSLAFLSRPGNPDSRLTGDFCPKSISVILDNLVFKFWRFKKILNIFLRNKLLCIVGEWGTSDKPRDQVMHDMWLVCLILSVSVCFSLFLSFFLVSDRF